jgi:tetratricopeptide (TPR) repeat protein
VNLPVAGLLIGLLLPAQAQDEVDRARRLIEERRAAEAVDVLRPLTTPDSKNVAAFLALGDALKALRRNGEALAAYRRAGDLQPESIPALVGQAEMRARLRQFPASEEMYRKVLAADPQNLEARVGLARILSLQRKLDEALKEVQAVLAARPDHVDARIRLGWIRLWRHERDEAVKVFEALIADHPGHVEAALGLAAAEQARGNGFHAGNLLEALARLHPDNVDVLMALARSRARRGQSDDARQTLQRIGELDADHIEALQLGGELAIREERFAEAEKMYRRALELEPEDTGSRNGLATALRRQGRREEARYVYRRLLETDPDHANARIGLGWEYTWGREYEAAAAEFDHVLKRDPLNIDALAGLARVRYLQGRWRDSQELYERALQADPWDEAVIDGHARVRQARESRARFAYLHAEEFERDQAQELDTLRLRTDALSLSWRKQLSAATGIEVEARSTFTREINRASDSDNYDIRHLALYAGARHQAAEHWTFGAKAGAGRFDDARSGGTWSFDGSETFLEAQLWASGDWDGHLLTFAWARSPLVIKAFPSDELDVLTVATTTVRYDSPWLKDGLTPEGHENRIAAEMFYSFYSDDNERFGLDVMLQHSWLYDGGWRLGPLVRFRLGMYDEDVAFYYSYDRQIRLSAGFEVDYQPPGEWSARARYQATSTETEERVNPGSHLFDPTQPIDLTEKTVSTDGHAIDAHVTWTPGGSTRAGLDGVYTWDNDHYITWALGVYVELGF